MCISGPRRPPTEQRGSQRAYATYGEVASLSTFTHPACAGKKNRARSISFREQKAETEAHQLTKEEEPKTKHPRGLTKVVVHVVHRISAKRGATPVHAGVRAVGTGWDGGFCLVSSVRPDDDGDRVRELGMGRDETLLVLVPLLPLVLISRCHVGPSLSAALREVVCFSVDTAVAVSSPGWNPELRQTRRPRCVLYSTPGTKRYAVPCRARSRLLLPFVFVVVCVFFARLDGLQRELRKFVFVPSERYNVNRGVGVEVLAGQTHGPCSVHIFSFPGLFDESRPSGPLAFSSCLSLGRGSRVASSLRKVRSK
ncbi:hypothetical protein BDW22DRAFT_1266693 [Trametopsis cervina]|nr:hypothetical protein BDW22DRAFT_1266693 [Trametopsis cervina]